MIVRSDIDQNSVCMARCVDRLVILQFYFHISEKRAYCDIHCDLSSVITVEIFTKFGLPLLMYWWIAEWLWLYAFLQSAMLCESRFRMSGIFAHLVTVMICPIILVVVRESLKFKFWFVAFVVNSCFGPPTYLLILYHVQWYNSSFANNRTMNFAVSYSILIQSLNTMCRGIQLRDLT